MKVSYEWEERGKMMVSSAVSYRKSAEFIEYKKWDSK